MGILAVIGTLVSAMIGSAIFSLSGTSIELGGGFSVISWAIAGLIMLLYAMLTSQLSLIFPRNGGLYYFPRLSFSNKPILASGLALISSLGTVVCNIIAVGFSAALVPVFLNINPSLHLYLAIAAILLCVVFNMLKLSFRGRLNTAFAIILFAFLVVYNISIFSNPQSSLERVAKSFESSSFLSSFLKTTSSIPIATLGYGAIVSVCFIAGDVKNKKKNIPLGVFVSSLIVIILYCASILSTISITGHKDLGNSVFYKSIKMAFAPQFSAILSFVIIIALISTINVMINISIDTLKAISDDGFLPRAFGRTSKSDVPYISLIVFAIISALTLIKGYVFRLISLGAIFSILTIIVNLESYIKVYGTKKSEYMQKHGNIYAAITLILLVISSLSSIFADKSALMHTLLFTFAILIFIMCLFLSRVDRGKFRGFRVNIRIAGQVKHGNALGRLVGMPTANIYPTTEQIAQLKDYMGVWASFVFIDNLKYFAVTNIGTRPSIDDDSRIVVESHILGGFTSDIYGKEITVEPVEFIRPIIKLGSLQEVKNQVEQDKSYAIKVLKQGIE